MKNDQFKVSLDPELKRWLREEATRLHCSVAQVIRSLVVQAKEGQP